MKKIKFGDSSSTEIEPKSNCYYPRAPNDKYLDNDSLNTLKRDLQICLPSNGCFLLDDIQFKCPKSSEKEGTECEVVEFDHVYETKDDTEYNIETVDNFPLLFN